MTRRFRLLVCLWLLVAAPRVFAVAAVPDHIDPKMRRQLMAAVQQSTSFSNRYAAEVWLLDMSTRLAPMLPDTGRRMALLRAVHADATRAGISPQIVLALIQVESRFQRFAISGAGARGLMQVMPFWVKEIGKPDDNLFDMQTNLRYGCTILAYYLKIEHGNIIRALARYNGSLGQYWYPMRVQAALNQRWETR
ncbi:MAG: transglycosylase SLT domain-containing protein [Salinisphaera sp.]|jgi:soluble lytic murein transglycosylase-like protein|nr:transglycosylase SLT domain-containing protein [Salinisphaera sp.]